MAKYDKYTKEQLLKVIEKLENQKKFGLVWEEKTEEVAEQCKTNFPVLQEIPDRVIVGNDPQSPTHLIIEGDNYHSLSVLNVTHKGKIDVIYIDPPYNTGNKATDGGFIYNDRFVDKEDCFRHSKWLSFMEKRLNLAKELLNENGIIFISIDDNEQSHLKLLCDEIFGEKNFCSTIHWRKNRKPHNAGATMSTSYEFILVYYKLNSFKLAQEFAEMKTDEKGNYAIYPVIKADKRERTYTLKAGLKCEISQIEAKIYETGRNANLNIEYLDATNVVNGRTTADIRLKARYCLTDENGKLSVAINEDNIFINKNGFPKEKRYRTEKDVKVDNHHWDIEKGKNEDANEELEKLFSLNIVNNIFTNPKPTALIKKIISTINRNNLIVLDFFAGSGTTGHALLELNDTNESDENHQFILCTNNENNICEEVTYPRIKKVTEGYADKAAIPANVRYFKTDFIEQSEDTDENRVRLTERCYELLQIKESCYESQETSIENLRFWRSANKLLAVIFDRYDKIPDAKYINEINLVNQKNLKNQGSDIDDIVVYRFTIDGNLDMDISTLPNARLEEIPEEILKTFNQIFKTKKKRK